ncbi:MAG: type I secretion system permease/ATPase [Endozoicomonas sp.]
MCRLAPEWMALEEGLRLISSLFQCRHQLDSLIAGLPREDGSLAPESFVRALARAGIEGQLSSSYSSFERIEHFPAVILSADNSCFIVTSIDVHGSSVEVLDNDGRTELSLKAVAEVFDGRCILLRQIPEEVLVAPYADTAATGKRFGWFFNTLKEGSVVYRDVLIASLMVNLLALASPLFVMNVYDRVVPSQAYETLWMLVLGMLIALAFDLALRLLRSRYIDVVGRHVDLKLSALMLERLLGLKLVARPARVGTLLNSITDFEHVRTFITSSTVLAFVDLPFIFLFLGLIAWVGGYLVLVPLTCMALSLLVAWVINRPLQRAIEVQQQTGGERQSFLLDSLQSLVALKTSGSESQTQSRWEKFNRYLADNTLRIRYLQTASSQTATALLQLNTVLLVAAGVYKIGVGELSMGGLIAMTMLSGRCSAPIAQVIGLLNQYQKTRQSLEYADEIMSLPQERPLGRRFLQPEVLNGHYVVDNLSFAYPEAPPLLHDLSLEIHPGEKVAVIGAMGAGKSTLLQLLAGLREPSSGHISLDGMDLRQIDPSFVRRKLSYVPQRVELISGTLRDNITLGQTSVDEQQLLDAVIRSGLEPMIRKGQLGLDTPVGENGRNLSGGQAHCAGLARALLNQPDILILDEPTSAMDSQAETLFGNMLQSLKGKTVIIVTHKMKLLEGLDRIVVLDNGRLAASGNAASILNKSQAGQAGRRVAVS